MELLINDKVTIRELQQQFNSEFPYLKIEFFNALPTGNGLHKSNMYANDRAIGTCRRMHNEGTLSITPADAVEVIEKKFWSNFGLTVEVFRKSGNLWIETTLSDSWTLKRQNEEGKAFSNGWNNIKRDEEEDPLDRDLWQ